MDRRIQFLLTESVWPSKVDMYLVDCSRYTSLDLWTLDHEAEA